MTKDETRYAIAVMQAYVDGKEIEFRHLREGKFFELKDPSSPSWDFHTFEYRIKPSPKVIWVNEYPDDAIGVHATQEKAKQSASSRAARIAVPYREITD